MAMKNGDIKIELASFEDSKDYYEHIDSVVRRLNNSMVRFTEYDRTESSGYYLIEIKVEEDS